MKRMLALLIIMLCVVLAFCSCGPEERTEVTDYQYMYDGIVDDWNKHSTGKGRDSLLGFGEYLYNSELILFPRETPSTLQEYYFHWTPLIDFDGYAIYFSCVLESSNYYAFANGLEAFEVTNGSKTTKLIYDTEHFSLPTYILQWKRPGDNKYEVLEYIMLDEASHTAVFVYTMTELEYIEANSNYTVTPTELHFLEDDFSIYEEFEGALYDISFLEYLK